MEWVSSCLLPSGVMGMNSDIGVGVAEDGSSVLLDILVRGPAVRMFCVLLWLSASLSVVVFADLL